MLGLDGLQRADRGEEVAGLALLAGGQLGQWNWGGGSWGWSGRRLDEVELGRLRGNCRRWIVVSLAETSEHRLVA